MKSSRRIFSLSIGLMSLLFAPRITVAADASPTTRVIRGPVEIATAVDKGEAYIGDLIRYSVTIIHDTSVAILVSPVGANLGGFDVKDYLVGEEVRRDDGRFEITSVFTLSTFTTGDYIIPAIPVAFTTKTGDTLVASSDVTPIIIKSLLGNAGDSLSDSLDIKPLKDPIFLARARWWLWGAIGFVVLAVVGFFIWRRRRAAQAAAEPIDLRPAWEKALERLARLGVSEHLAEGRLKEYYTELADTLRGFLGSIYTFNAPDMTTDETIVALKISGAPQSEIEDAHIALARADLVKFAKLIPDPERPREDFERVYAQIGRVRDLYIERQRREEEARRLAETQTASQASNGSHPLAEKETATAPAGNTVSSVDIRVGDDRYLPPGRGMNQLNPQLHSKPRGEDSVSLGGSDN